MVTRNGSLRQSNPVQTACIRYVPGIPSLPLWGKWTGYAVLATVFGSLGQVLMTSGMKRGKAGTSALGNYTAVSRWCESNRS